MLNLRTDTRGALFEAIRARGQGRPFSRLTRDYPRQSLHTRKFERFLVCSGEAEICVRRLFTDQVHVFRVSGRAPCCIDMPTFHPHSITNTGSGN